MNAFAFNGATNATTESAAIRAEFITSISAQAWFSDNAAAGNVKFQASNDPVSPTHWNDVPSTAQTVAAGATTLIPNTLCCYEWVRVVWTRTGGGGTFTVRVKSLGAS